MKRSSLQRKSPMARIKPLPGILRTAKVVSGKVASGKQRTRKCAICPTRFTPRNMMHKACGPDCAAAVAVREREKKERKKLKAERAADKAALEKHKPLEYWLKKAEAACNAYIRARDPDICISCDVTHSSAWQAGHYISVGANRALRFHEDNIHKQCIHCNMFKSSNATEYRIRLLEKIGVERVEWLESWHSPVKMTREAAEEIEAMYKAKLRELSK